MPAPPSIVSAPKPPINVSFPSPPSSVSAPSPPDKKSLPPPPAISSLPSPDSTEIALPRTAPASKLSELPSLWLEASTVKFCVVAALTTASFERAMDAAPSPTTIRSTPRNVDGAMEAVKVPLTNRMSLSPAPPSRLSSADSVFSISMTSLPDPAMTVSLPPLPKPK